MSATSMNALNWNVDGVSRDSLTDSTARLIAELEETCSNSELDRRQAEETEAIRINRNNLLLNQIIHLIALVIVFNILASAVTLAGWASWKLIQFASTLEAEQVLEGISASNLFG